MSNTNTNNPNNKPLRIDVDTPEKFEELAATSLTTTQKLAKRINKLFSSVFVDYHGSIVYCTAGNGNTNPNQQFMVELHFKPVAIGSVDTDDRVRAFAPIEEQSQNNVDLVAKLQSIYGSLNTSERFKLTSEGAQILSEFMLPGTNVNPWKPETYAQFKSEYQENQLYGQSPVMVKISGLDLIRLIKKIYGFKNSNGKKVDYGVIPYGPITPNINNQMMQSAANWRVMIMQIDAEKTLDLASEFGIIPANNGGGTVVTGF